MRKIILGLILTLSPVAGAKELKCTIEKEIHAPTGGCSWKSVGSFSMKDNVTLDRDVPFDLHGIDYVFTFSIYRPNGNDDPHAKYVIAAIITRKGDGEIDSQEISRVAGRQILFGFWKPEVLPSEASETRIWYTCM